MYNVAKMSFFEDAYFGGNEGGVSAPPPHFLLDQRQCSGTVSVSLFDCQHRRVKPSLSPLK